MMPIREERLERAMCALEGLSVGDSFGEQFFYLPDSAIEQRAIPAAPWWYTDDTNMAFSIIEVLGKQGIISQDMLAQSFATRYDPDRGYGLGMHHLLRDIRQGAVWRAAAGKLFGGAGSYGNGAAMRVAPLGAYFADDPALLIEQARLSAEVTHTHAEGIAGAIAIAVAAAWAWRLRIEGTRPRPRMFLDLILPDVPASAVHRMIRRARDLPDNTSNQEAAGILGNGREISAQDTVPLVLWCAAHYLTDYEEALWQTVRVLGDMDTTCAMVGGIVAMYTGIEGIPDAWRQAREPLPAFT